MKQETFDRLHRLNEELRDVLCDPDVQQNDFVEHTLYAAVRSLNAMMNKLEASLYGGG